MEEGKVKVTADSEGGGVERAREEKRMDGWERKCESGRTRAGCGKKLPGKREGGRREERQIGWRGKREAERPRDTRRSLAIRHGVIMADGNHSHDSLCPTFSLSTYIYIYIYTV